MTGIIIADSNSFPNEVSVGDTINLKYTISQQGFDTITAGNVYYLMEGATAEVTVAMTVGTEEVTASFSIDSGRSGVLRYRIQLTGTDSDSNTVTRTIEQGQSTFLNTTDTAKSQAEVLLDELNRVYLAKLQGRNDIVSYAMGGRNIATMSLGDLEMAISRMEHRVENEKRAARGGKRRHILWRRRR